MYVFFVPASGANWCLTKYNKPEVIKLIREMSATLDEAKRQEIYAKIQRMSMDDAPLVALSCPHLARTGIADVVKGLATLPLRLVGCIEGSMCGSSE